MAPLAHTLVGPGDTPPDGYVPTNLIAPSKLGVQRRVWVSTSAAGQEDHIVVPTGAVSSSNTWDRLVERIVLTHRVDRETLLDARQRRRPVSEARRQLIVQALALTSSSGKPLFSKASLARRLGVDHTTVRHAVARHNQAKEQD
ncbi:LysR family transcriptional regulator [Caulobacter phage KcrB]|nr:hypothetical protein RW_GP042 [Caulobacter phage RW]WCA46346.1 LysR family transcriptional regulator [Caulobacter phage KcrB]WCD56281.1 LysR family transcriptional regulator [Caulobacter phage RLK]WNV48073.1 transcriptional regulator, LysR family [Caulobacter phage GB2A]